jgi:hypothetical protein
MHRPCNACAIGLKRDCLNRNVQEGETAHPSVARLYADARDSSRFHFRLEYALVEGRWLVKLFKGMSAEPKSL